ncbi:hypothetical protein HYALB_00009443 [Hymenoscyphus albidus]|uniref:Uncharacterized protein n=1 Tax=Hymenoscyphus albidus TaxID=595503 RepID=A0A9N9LSD1_9HELO|nr:hypothetical protein HYALB_00009443 [Hymenoscyphus albidus]
MAAIDTTRTLSFDRRNDISDIYVAIPNIDEAGRKAAFEGKFRCRPGPPTSMAQAIRPGDERRVIMDAIYPGHDVSKAEAKKISGRYQELWGTEEYTDEECAFLAAYEMDQFDHLKRGWLYRHMMNALEKYFLEK